MDMHLAPGLRHNQIRPVYQMRHTAVLDLYRDYISRCASHPGLEGPEPGIMTLCAATLPRRGYYILVFKLDRQLKVDYAGRNAILPPGVYAYIGSALNSLPARVRRHVGQGASRVHWHIDRITTSGGYKPLAVVACPSAVRGLEECIAGGLWNRGLRGPRGFGCSDTRSPTHLFRLPSEHDSWLAQLTGVIRECCGAEPVIAWCR